jgi:hypothetical protein
MEGDGRKKTVWVEMESPESTPQTKQGDFGGNLRAAQLAELGSKTPVGPRRKRKEGEMF